MLGVPHSPASEAFTAWLRKRAPLWPFADVFLAGIPVDWTFVSIGKWDLCYLANEAVILETAERYADETLLQVGCFMEGSSVIIDTSNHELMIMGQVNPFDYPENTLVERSMFVPFGIDYISWLSMIRLNPESTRFLGGNR